MRIRMFLPQYIIILITLLSLSVPVFVIVITAWHRFQLYAGIIMIILSLFFIITCIIVSFRYFFYYLVITDYAIVSHSLLNKQIINKESIVKISYIIDTFSHKTIGEEIKDIVITFKTNNEYKHLKLNVKFFNIKKLKKALEENNYKIDGIY